MKKKVKDLGLSSGGPFVIVVNEKDAIHLGLHALDRVRIQKNSKYIICVVDVFKHSGNLKDGYIGLFEESFSELKLKNNDVVEIAFSK